MTILTRPFAALQDAGHAAGGRQSPIPFQPSADSSILPIITSQRDRFRARNAELEEVRLYLG